MAASAVSTPVSYLTRQAHRVLDHLNSRRLFPNDDGLHRDFRGLSNLFGISTQEAERLTVQSALERWTRSSESATVGQLLRYLEVIDRYDVRDDLQDLADRDELVIEQRQTMEEQEPSNPLLTMGDLERGVPQTYDALVLYAEENSEFVDRMVHIMEEIGFKLFTKHGLRPGVMEYGAMVEMIDARCRYTILVFSPEFFQSLDNRFYSQYVHAKQIADNGHKMIPIRYQPCPPPNEFRFTSLLRNDSNIWRSLAVILNSRRTPSIAVPSWISAVGVESTTFPTVRVNDYVANYQNVNGTSYRPESNRQEANSNFNRSANTLPTVRVDDGLANGQGDNRNTHQTDTKSHFSRSTNSLTTVCVNEYIANGEVTNRSSYRREPNRRGTNSNFSQTTHIFPTVRVNEYFANGQVIEGTSYRADTNRHFGPNSPDANRVLDSPQVSNERSDHSAYHPNSHITDSVTSDTNTQGTKDSHLQPANDYVLTVQIVTDHFGEHSNITDHGSSQCNTYISSSRTVNDQSSLSTSATRHSFINNFARWCRRRHTWLARNTLFKNRVRTVRAN